MMKVQINQLCNVVYAQIKDEPVYCITRHLSKFLLTLIYFVTYEFF